MMSQIQRIYTEYDITGLTLEETRELIQKEAEYAADYGFEIKDTTTLKISQN
jgi:maleate cis-trans isomerase